MSNSQNRLRHAVQRVDAHDLMTVLHYIATHGGVGTAELKDVTGLSKATLLRMLSSARKQFGVVISYHRNSVSLGVGEFTIEDWGVFDRAKLIERIKNIYDK